MPDPCRQGEEREINAEQQFRETHQRINDALNTGKWSEFVDRVVTPACLWHWL